MTYGQSNADRHFTRPRLPAPLLDDLRVVTLTNGMGVRGCGYNGDGTRMQRMGEFTIDGRRVQPKDMPPFLPAAYNEVQGTSLLHVAGAMAGSLTGAPMVGIRAASKGGLRLVARPTHEGVAGIYRLADGSVSPILSLLIEEAAEIKAHLVEACQDAPSVVYILFVHGEADRSTPAADYVRDFREARALIAEGLARHQLEPRWIVTQPAGTFAAGDGNAWQSRIAIMKAIAEDPDLTFLGPLYPYSLIDGIHYDSRGKALIGELSGRVVAMMERGGPWVTPQVDSWEFQDNRLLLHCTAAESLALDEGVEGLAHYGFSIVDHARIRDVTLEGPSTIALALDGVSHKKFNLDYAFKRTSRQHPDEARNHCYAQGAVRTTYGQASEAVPGETLRKWLPGFRLAIDPNLGSGPHACISQA